MSESSATTDGSPDRRGVLVYGTSGYTTAEGIKRPPSLVGMPVTPITSSSTSGASLRSLSFPNSTLTEPVWSSSSTIRWPPDVVRMSLTMPMIEISLFSPVLRRPPFFRTLSTGRALTLPRIISPRAAYRYRK
ncbi:MAG: hypothetical protein A4E28_01030 [Methanocella sp. PtaU1.Bin125]|nr:MAG: hypothetical protein A4E28_01030 [Methanocella sp. PtaU1.Bin125]